MSNKVEQWSMMMVLNPAEPLMYPPIQHSVCTCRTYDLDSLHSCHVILWDRHQWLTSVRCCCLFQRSCSECRLVCFSRSSAAASSTCDLTAIMVSKHRPCLADEHCGTDDPNQACGKNWCSFWASSDDAGSTLFTLRGVAASPSFLSSRSAT